MVVRIMTLCVGIEGNEDVLVLESRAETDGGEDDFNITASTVLNSP